MSKQKIGFILFWVAVCWAIVWGIVISYFVDAALHLTMDELSETMWALDGPWYLTWGLLGVPLGALVAGLGVLLYSEARGSTIWMYAIGVLLVLFVGMMSGGYVGHIPVLFGIGGAIILLSFVGILWFWAKERAGLDGVAATAANFKLVGYVFMLIAVWFICGGLGMPFMESLEGMEPASPLHIMLFLALGWLFLFLGHYKTRQ